MGAAKLRKKTLHKCMSTIKQLIPEVNTYVTKPIHFLGTLAKKLHLSEKTAKLAKLILYRIEEYRLLTG